MQKICEVPVQRKSASWLILTLVSPVVEWRLLRVICYFLFAKCCDSTSASGLQLDSRWTRRPPTILTLLSYLPPSATMAASSTTRGWYSARLGSWPRPEERSALRPLAGCVDPRSDEGGRRDWRERRWHWSRRVPEAHRRPRRRGWASCVEMGGCPQWPRPPGGPDPGFTGLCSLTQRKALP